MSFSLSSGRGITALLSGCLSGCRAAAPAEPDNTWTVMCTKWGYRRPHRRVKLPFIAPAISRRHVVRGGESCSTCESSRTELQGPDRQSSLLQSVDSVRSDGSVLTGIESSGSFDFGNTSGRLVLTVSNTRVDSRWNAHLTEKQNPEISSSEASGAAGCLEWVYFHNWVHSLHLRPSWIPARSPKAEVNPVDPQCFRLGGIKVAAFPMASFH